METVVDKNLYCCLQCRTRGKRRTADTVAGAADGLEWFECGDHEPTDNIGGVTRVRSEPLKDWRARHGIVAR
jgi:hypothetical protein